MISALKTGPTFITLIIIWTVLRFGEFLLFDRLEARVHGRTVIYARTELAVDAVRQNEKLRKYLVVFLFLSVEFAAATKKHRCDKAVDRLEMGMFLKTHSGFMCHGRYYRDTIELLCNGEKYNKHQEKGRLFFLQIKRNFVSILAQKRVTRRRIIIINNRI